MCTDRCSPNTKYYLKILYSYKEEKKHLDVSQMNHL